MGLYLGSEGLGSNIGWFYSVQGFVSLCMPALMGIVADKWIQAQRLLGLCHALAGLFMFAGTLFALSMRVAHVTGTLVKSMIDSFF